MASEAGKLPEKKIDLGVVRTVVSLKAHTGGIEILPDGLRICFLILVDEAKTNPVGLNALARALDFTISDLLRCFDEKWLKG